MSRICIRRLGHNEVDVVRSARLKGIRLKILVFLYQRGDLGYLRAKIAAAMRKWSMSRICIRRLGHNEVDAMILSWIIYHPILM